MAISHDQRQYSRQLFIIWKQKKRKQSAPPFTVSESEKARLRIIFDESAYLPDDRSRRALNRSIIEHLKRLDRTEGKDGKEYTGDNSP